VKVEIEIGDDFVEQVAQRVAELLAEPQEPASPYATVDEAAEYLRCQRQRIYDLVSSRRLTKYRDGARVLVSRQELDEHLEGVAPWCGPPPANVIPRKRRHNQAGSTWAI
jgi:excisionase family DNA binding protein